MKAKKLRFSMVAHALIEKTTQLFTILPRKRTRKFKRGFPFSIYIAYGSINYKNSIFNVFKRTEFGFKILNVSSANVFEVRRMNLIQKSFN